MSNDEMRKRIASMINPKVPIGRQHLVELVASDPVLRLAPYQAIVQEMIDDGALTEEQTESGTVLKAVASPPAGQGVR